MAISLPPLPYAKDALAPYISANTLDFHYGKHHKAYVDNVNKLIEGTDLAEKSLEEIIKISAKDTAKTGIFNNAAQVWNHSFYWQCLKKNGGAPRGPVADKIKTVWGGFEKFADELKNAGITQFGSGWAWLVLEDNQLKITKTANADTPIAHGQKPLLTIDVWEHAYYLDYQNRRPDYLAAVIQNLINWDFVNANLA
ncbi:MAG TPA: superoxide dismutase [Smithellaceae bacterium]|jgi:Fe-Mn family superoxide dismutase|nr:superoxide dismutase [Syntrophaceae bacterium]MDX9815699.1 superoxide dismutase [Smithellaceae bacterium]NMD04691.1 superoxide dismutase [Deltaproteobacteria bacterium]MBP8609221.1 superoxide dismutase [Syntrophaceae bacterium]HNQ18481.1 superoxide dismutase [Smithellaceae bacterium]